MIADDSDLLRLYADNQSEEAFAELVRRYLNLVYFAALRQVGHDAHRAEDVAQAVFTQLAQKASTLVRHQTLAGWLHTTTRYIASETLRAERRRLAREHEAQVMEHAANDLASSADWEKLRHIIDATLEELSERDREAVLLRFFTNLPHAQIGQKLNLTENSARMRVERALEKLRRALSKRGVTSTAAALSLVLANQALASAPTGLATTIINVALTGATKTALTAVTMATTTKTLALMTTTKFILGAGGLLLITAAAITWQQRQTNVELRKQITSLRVENQKAVAERKSAEDVTRAEHAELLRLRATKGILDKQPAAPTTTNQSDTTAKAGAPSTNTPAMTEMVSMNLAAKKSGRETPTDAARTLLWYLQGGDIKHAADLLAFEPAEKDKLKDFIDTLPENIQDQYSTPAKLIAFAMAGTPKPITGVQLLSETQPDDYTSIQHVRLQYKNGEVREDDIKFHRDVDGWKEVVSAANVDRVIAYLKKKP
jgi:RNA polymerase sigma factor (sigma-70 family)